MFFRALGFFTVIFATTVAQAVDLNREMILTPVAGSTPEDMAIATAQVGAAAEHAGIADYERLAWAFVAKARRTLDAGFYRFAAVTAAEMDVKFGPTPEAELIRGHVDHNLHRFADAEHIARHLVTEREMPEDWALLSDALMEQGKLTEAITALQHLVNLKPGAEADTRIAHLRWLKGDLPGAIAAMSAAIRETSVDDTSGAAWMLARLSGYYLQSGDLVRAERLAERARKRQADYAPALLASGRVALAKHAFRDAVTFLTQAENLNPLPEYQWWLADAQRAAGDDTAANATEAKLRSQGAANDPRTLALFLATHHDASASAVTLAREELGVRRDVFTHDALAWALLAQGDSAAAEHEMGFALAEGTADPRLFFHAAAIALAQGRWDAARQMALRSEAASAALLPSERAQLNPIVAGLGAPPGASSALAVARPATAVASPSRR